MQQIASRERLLAYQHQLLSDCLANRTSQHRWNEDGLVALVVNRSVASTTAARSTSSLSSPSASSHDDVIPKYAHFECDNTSSPSRVTLQIPLHTDHAASELLPPSFRKLAPGEGPICVRSCSWTKLSSPNREGCFVACFSLPFTSHLEFPQRQAVRQWTLKAIRDCKS